MDHGLDLLCFQKHGGVIVNISATLHYRGQPLQIHAGSAKAAVGKVTTHSVGSCGYSTNISTKLDFGNFDKFSCVIS